MSYKQYFVKIRLSNIICMLCVFFFVMKINLNVLFHLTFIIYLAYVILCAQRVALIQGLSIDTLVCLWFEIFRPAETVMSQNNGFFPMREVPAQNRKS